MRGQREQGPYSFQDPSHTWASSLRASQLPISLLLPQILPVLAASPCPIMPTGARAEPTLALQDSKLFRPCRIFILLVFPWSSVAIVISSNNKLRGERRGTASSHKWFQHPAASNPATDILAASLLPLCRLRDAPAGYLQSPNAAGGSRAQPLAEPGLQPWGHLQFAEMPTASSAPMHSRECPKARRKKGGQERGRSSRQLYQLTIYCFFKK